MSYETPTSTPDSQAEVVRKATYVEITDGEAGQRLDNWLIRTLKGLPRSLVYRLLRTGQVRVNGKRAKPDQRVAAGDTIRLPPQRDSAPPAAANAGPRSVPKSLTELIDAAIVREEKDVLVINKPAGVAVHGGSGLAFGVIEALRALRPDEELELVHRLDRETSGLLLVARTRRALRDLHAAHQKRGRGGEGGQGRARALHLQ